MNQPSFTLEMGEYKFEMNRQISREDNGNWLYQTVIKRSIGEDYVTEIKGRYFNDEQLFPFLNGNANRGGMPFQVEMEYEDEVNDFDTNMRISSVFIRNFYQKWNDSPIVAALANLGLADSEISSAVEYNISVEESD